MTIVASTTIILFIYYYYWGRLYRTGLVRVTVRWRRQQRQGRRSKIIGRTAARGVDEGRRKLDAEYKRAMQVPKHGSLHSYHIAEPDDTTCDTGIAPLQRKILVSSPPE